MSLGHQTHLEAGSLVAKADGESSMSGKPGCQDAAKRQARRGSDGMVKAGLPEPQCPNSKGSGRKRRMISGCSPRRLDFLCVRYEALRGSWAVCNGLNKDTKRAPKPS